MVKHIIFWKFNNTVNEKQKEEFIEQIRQSSNVMVNQIEGLISASVKKNLANSEFDFVYDATFTNLEAISSYQVHPLHVKHKQTFAPYLTKPVTADYELD